ncbi:MAG: hypothetical protein R3E12_06020 [Candidatus Eisenbacteria bacterium]|uniref:Uncharacterized protein n=1 Tax=Eiseniibacteriota bacterium TaxID=2212470 RepID=A0A956RPD0_UNCEI|nr:hypothetical protein [Candidatus Eisenbacteria bacterium]
MMPESTPSHPRPDSWAWLPSAVSAALSFALVIAVAIFFRVLFRLREPLSLTEYRLWILVLGFALIEAYLGRRTLLDGRRAWEKWRRR